MRTVVMFRSDAFNTTDSREYFINDCCFGDDVGQWLIPELRQRGIDVDAEPDQEDWGWYLTCRADGIEHTIGIGFRPGDTEADPGEWLCFITRRVGVFQRLAGTRKHDVVDQVPRAMHDALHDARSIRDVRWHFQADFDAGDESQPAARPDIGRTDTNE